MDACSREFLLTEKCCYEISTSFGFNKDHRAFIPCNCKQSAMKLISLQPIYILCV